VLAEPPLFTLQPGASRDVVLTAAIGAKAAEKLARLAHGGRVTFASNATTVQVPWVAVDAARVVVTHDLHSTALWDCDHGPGMTLSSSGGTQQELLMANGRCDLVLYSGSAENSATLIERPLQVDGDMEVAFTTADAMHDVRVAGVDRNGQPVGRGGYSADAPYSAMYELEFPPASRFRTLSFSTFSAQPVHMSEFDEGYTLTVSELFFDFPNRSIYSIHHQPLHGVRASTTLASLPGDLRHARVSVAPQREGTTLGALMMYMSGGWGFGTSSGASVNLEHGWSGDLYITPDATPDTWAGVGLITARAVDEVWLDIVTPSFRAIGGRIVATNDITPSPAEYSVAEGGTISIGETPVSSGVFVDTRDTAFAVFPGFNGPVNESMLDPQYGLHYEIRDDGGTLLREGTNDGYASADFGTRGAYRVTYRAKNGSEITARFDTSLPDYNPPTVSSLRIVDAGGQVVSRLQPGQPGTLAFSVADYTVTPDGTTRDSQQLRSTRVSWRLAGGDWQELPLTVALEDRGHPTDLGHIETGTHYRADLTAIAAAGALDLRIELADASGNTSTAVIPNALVVGPGRRRAVR
jgi:hypothetical protein